jgi:hypothetical protein
MTIEKRRHQAAGHRSHRFGPSSETILQLQLALEASEMPPQHHCAHLNE